MPEQVSELADALFELILTTSPFTATRLGLPGHDAEVPDESVEGEAALRTDLVRFDARLAATRPAGGGEASDLAERITAGSIEAAMAQLRLQLETAAVEYTVTPMQYAGPPQLFAVAARTVLADAAAAGDYLTRLRRSGAWIDQICDRLRVGRDKAWVPVAPLVDKTIAWADAQLVDPTPAVLLAPAAPAGWDGAGAWREELERVATDVVRPALARWRAVLAEELRPASRPAERPGLAHLPGGDGVYDRAIRLHTTLDFSAEQLHELGRQEVARLEERTLELGGEIGLTDLTDLHTAMRAASASVDPDAAIAAAISAIRRAEARAPEVFRPPLPPACAVERMPAVIAESGAAPHYTPPRQDGTRPGTYWFNTARPTAGAGWDLEVVAFHEAVPGHHLQRSRSQMLTDLPVLQSHGLVTAHSEGWALYAEQLADEMGLFSDVRARLGGVAAELMRAARLVVDTGIHTLGWSQAYALEYYTAHVPMPPEFLADEIDRYTVMPGQALAYQTGKREIIRLRDEARERLADRFDLAGFHNATLDSGIVALPVLRLAVQGWVNAAATEQHS